MTKTSKSLVAGLLLVVGALPALAQEPQVNGHTAVTVTGCVERETAYRTRIGDPGPATADDIVLSGAYTAALPNKRDDYGLTGRLEPQLIPNVDAEVQLVGFVEDATRYESPGHPVILPRLFVTSWQPTGNACPPH
jgi:hypothetical protein